MRWISFIGGVLFGGLVCFILGLLVGVLLGGALGRHSAYSDLCGYDAVFHFEDANAGDAVCEFLRSN